MFLKSFHNVTCALLPIKFDIFFAVWSQYFLIIKKNAAYVAYVQLYLKNFNKLQSNDLNTVEA